jgi:carboxypeptidase C (cathepsin A)
VCRLQVSFLGFRTVPQPKTSGMYIPVLAAKIAQSLSIFPNKDFKGVAIGNGYMHVQLNFNAQIAWAHYHGMIGGE